MNKNLYIIIFSLFFSSCEKQAGEGGTSVIEGQVWKIFTFQNPISGEQDTSYYQLDVGKDVFIIYSNDNGLVYDDKFETDYNGRYRFEYLRKGEYTIYTYADSTDVDMVKYDFPIFKSVNIEENNSVLTIDDFIIEENQ
jgi:hypothetical protein|tara:strand:- start:4682 stop:5098 length:417 start_codon:yes stop_codon:yes gene_type:complete